MARFKWPSRGEQKPARPAVSDDFIYDEPEGDSAAETTASDTPEQALDRLRETQNRDDAAEEFLRRRGGKKAVPAKALFRGISRSADREPSDDGGARIGPEAREEEAPPREPIRTSTGVELDENLQPIRTGRRRERRHPLLHRLALILITLVIVLTAASFIFHRILPNAPMLGAPENMISQTVTPVQGLFSGITEAIADYFRSRKLRANIEAEYNALRAENEQLVYKAMLADELQNTLRQYEDLSDEIAANANMKPIVCRVIGKSDSNYFSTFTINKGTNDGLENYMAVTFSGTLVGYTESVRATEATVRTIIDSEASIAGLIQSSRDQGTVRGTLGIDGKPMCRMYYLPDDNLPRPGDTVVTSGVGMSFPKGIPIGVVRESTRGMDSNKQYIVLEPNADFQHLEYVIVLRYKPVPEAIEGRENGRTNVELVPLESARPSPVVPQIASSLFESQTTQDPNATEAPTPEPTETPGPTPEPTATPSPTPEYDNLEYQVVRPQNENTPTATPSPIPTPTPYLTPDPGDMTVEEDDV